MLVGRRAVDLVLLGYGAGLRDSKKGIWRLGQDYQDVIARQQKPISPFFAALAVQAYVL